jgi:hypothetical protein
VLIAVTSSWMPAAGGVTANGNCAAPARAVPLQDNVARGVLVESLHVQLNGSVG